MSTRSTTHAAFDEVTDALGAVISTGGDVLADITPAIEDVADAAIDTVAATGRVGVRIVTRTVRFVARHPREVLVGIGLIAL